MDLADDVPDPAKTRSNVGGFSTLFLGRYGAREDDRIAGKGYLNIARIHVPGVRERIRNLFFKARSGVRVLWLVSVERREFEDHRCNSLPFASNARAIFSFNLFKGEDHR